MKTSSAKAKGKRLPIKLAEQIRLAFGLSDMDVLPTPNSINGMDLWLSEKAKECFPYAVESKNTEKLNVWSALEQAEKNKEGLFPILVFSRNHSKIYVAFEFDIFLQMTHMLYQLKQAFAHTHE